MSGSGHRPGVKYVLPLVEWLVLTQSSHTEFTMARLSFFLTLWALLATAYGFAPAVYSEWSTSVNGAIEVLEESDDCHQLIVSDGSAQCGACCIDWDAYTKLV